MMRNRYTPAALLSLAVAPLIWSLYFVMVYSLVSVSCAGSLAWIARPGVMMITGAALLALLAHAWMSRRHLSRLDRTEAQRRDAELISRVCIALCGLAAATMLWVAFPAFVLPPCAA